jgi:Bor protein
MKILNLGRITLVSIAVLIIAGCSTVTFVQYEQPGEHKAVNRWHHATINGMVEISRPLDVRTICDKRAWTKITTEHTFYNWLAVLISPKMGPIKLYSAWTNKVQCHEPLTA